MTERLQVLTSADSLWRAEISTTGAALVSLWRDGVEIVSSPNGQARYAFAGVVMAPWPNRLEDGRFTFNGVDFTTAINDSHGHNANHGLVFDQAFDIVDQETQLLRLRTSLFNAKSYAFNVDVQVTYALSNDGLNVHLEVTNHEAKSVPFAIGIHPYFVTEPNSKLEVSASTFVTKNDRGLPVGQIELNESNVIQAGSNLIADLNIDDCLTGLTPNADEFQQSTISRDSHNLEVVLSQSKNLSHLMIFRFDELGQDRRTLLALEPQSAPANALRNEPINHLLAAGETKKYECAITARRTA